MEETRTPKNLKDNKLSTTLFRLIIVCSKMKIHMMLFANLCIVVTMILLNSVEGGDSVRCVENERRALEFKAGVVDEDGTLSSWRTNSNECCNWRGIRCSNHTGHVTVLDLPGELNIHHDGTSAGLIGKVSPLLSELKQLKYLNLSNNGLYGEISHQLANLTDLRYLDLRSSFGLTVENLDWVARLQWLTYLDLSNINLNNSHDWLQQIYKLSSLTKLHLSECSLPEYDPSLSVNSSFLGLNSLVSIDLSYNNFASPKSYNWLFNFTTSLAYVDLTLNPFENYRIPEAFGRMMFLESLVLSLGELEGFLPDSFGNLSRLATLVLKNNNLNGSLYEFLHPFATKKNSLQAIDLRCNQLSGSLPDFLTRFPSLRILSISNNKLGGSFQNNFGQLSSSLVHLDLSYNQITGPPPNLTSFSLLETLDLAFNKLEGTILEAYLSDLSKLNYLDLSSNSLFLKFGFDWVPPFQLDIIQLQNCSLGPQFPNWIKSQRNFSTLDISHARISDTIPPWFWDHSPSLRALNMSNNQINGVLPNISLTSPDIAWIDLSYNLLQGPIPPLPEYLGFLDLSNNVFSGSLSFICSSSHTQLFYLELSDNKLSGALPADCFMNSPELNTLQLANNDFSGNIPTSIGLLYQLRRLQLRNNSFTGQLPWMKNTYLQLLDLSKNKITGEIPSWIGYGTSLIVLSLRDNEFSGSIPPEICHLQNAQVLDLSHNNLTESIPHCINNLTALVEIETDNMWVIQGDMYGDDTSKFVNALVQWKGVASEYERTLIFLKLIDLSRNNLVGEIPEEFASLKGLISLNLSSNNLSGNIIPDIGQMMNLENLDLSRNHLSGNIPLSLANLSLLSVLDLSNNNLTGRIPSSTQLQSFDASRYAGNEQLCGLPLSNKCGGVHVIDKDENNEEHDDKFLKKWVYASVVLGFGTGFWGFIGPIMLQRRWRHSYYNFLCTLTDWIYITTRVHLTRLLRKFCG